MSIVDSILKRAGLSANKITEAKRKYGRSQIDSPEAKFIGPQEQQYQPTILPQQRPTGLIALPDPIKKTIGSAVVRYAQNKTFSEPEAQKIKSIINATKFEPPKNTIQEQPLGLGQRYLPSNKLQLQAQKGAVKSFLALPFQIKDFVSQNVSKPVINKIFGEGAFERGQELDMFAKRPEFLTKAITPQTPAEQEGFERGQFAQFFFLPEVSASTKAPNLFKGFYNILTKRSIPLAAQDAALAAVQQGELNDNVAYTALAAGAFPFVTAGVGNIANGLMHKNKFIEGVEIKKALSQLTSGREIGATKEALDAAQDLLNKNSKGNEILDAAKNGVTTKVKRDFIKWAEELFSKNPEPTPQIAGFLEDVKKTKAPSIPVINKQFDQAVEIFKENRLIGFKGLDDPNIRPGIDKPTELPFKSQFDDVNLEQQIVQQKVKTKEQIAAPILNKIEKKLEESAYTQSEIDQLQQTLKQFDQNTLKNLRDVRTIIEKNQDLDVEGIRKKNPTKVNNALEAVQEIAPNIQGDDQAFEFIANLPKTPQINALKQTIKENDIKIADLDKQVQDVMAEGTAMNSLAQKILDSKIPTKQQKNFIKNNPKSIREVLHDEDIENFLKDMSEQELREIAESQKNNSVGTMAAAQLIVKLQNEGRILEVNGLLDDVMESATASARNLRMQAKLNEWLFPETKVQRIKKKLEESNYSLKPEDEKELLELFKVNKNKLGKYKQAVNEMRKEPTKQNLEKAKKLREDYNDHLRTLLKKQSAFIPPNIWNSLTTITQGTLLTPLSLSRNLFFNIAFLPQRLGIAKPIEAAIDMTRAYITGGERYANYGQTKEFIKGLKPAGKEFVDIIKKGATPEELSKLDNVSILAPFRDLASFWTGENMPISKTTGKPTIYTRADKLVRGLLGIPAEPMFRSLAAADVLTRIPEEKRLASGVADMLGLKGVEKEIFIEFPTKDHLDRIKAKASEITLQQDNIVSDTLANFSRMAKASMGDQAHGFFRWLGKSLSMPYVKTPVNHAMTVYQYNSPSAMTAKATFHAYRAKAFSKQGKLEKAAYETEKAQESIAIAITGAIFAVAAGLMVKEGIYKGDIYEGKKQGLLAKNAGLPNGHINLSALKRFMGGDMDTSYRDGEDTTIDALGLSAFGAALEIAYVKEFTKEKRSERAEKLKLNKSDEDYADKAFNLLEDVVTETFVTLGFSLDQSMAQSVSQLLETIQEIDSAQGPAKLQSFIRNASQVIISPFLPNTLTSFGRIDDNTLREVRGDTTKETFINVLKTRTFQSDELPPVTGLFGEEVQRFKGADDVWDLVRLNLLDPYDVRKKEADVKYQELARLTEVLDDTSIIPPIPQKDDMQIKEHLKLQKHVGKARGKLYEAAISSPFYKQLSDKQKGNLLKNLNSEGLSQGKATFKGDIPEQSTLLEEWQAAADYPDLTIEQLGQGLDSLGIDVTESGKATTTQYKAYKEKIFALKGRDPDDEYLTQVKETLKTYTKGASKKAEKQAVIDAQRKALQALFNNGDLDQEEVLYIFEQVKPAI